MSEEVRRFIHVEETWTEFKVKGEGMTVAVLDTGLFVGHDDFAAAGKIPAQQNFTSDNAARSEDVADGDGHGTNVAGIIAANKVNVGIAPERDC